MIKVLLILKFKIFLNTVIVFKIKLKITSIIILTNLLY